MTSMENSDDLVSLEQISVPTDNLAVVCRLCLNMNEKLFSLYRMNELESVAITLSMKISLCTTVKISKHDMLPQKLCQNCLNIINEWYKFRRRSIRVDAVLKKHVSDHKDAELEKKFPKYFDIEFDGAEVDDGFNMLLDVPQADCDETDKQTNEEAIFTDLDKQPSPIRTEDHKGVEAVPVPLSKERRKKFKCSLCPDSFYYFKDLKQHKLLMHKIIKKEKKKGKKNEKKSNAASSRPYYEMKCCGKVFYCKAMFTRHYKNRHPGEKPFMCDVCGKKDFISEETLKRHKVLHTGKYRCNICDRTFTCNAILLIHKRDKHEDDKPFVCDVCGKRFVTELLMNYHKRFHTGDKRYVCEECGLAVVTSSSLAKHKRIHDLVKPHVCEICGKGFIMKSRLVEHLRVHSGERPYTCDVCHKGFTMRDKLKRHVRIHSGEKLFSCEFCGNNYATRYGLSVHFRTHVKVM